MPPAESRKSTAESIAPAIADKVRWARAAGRSLRIRGTGTWMDAGRPVRAHETFSIAEHRGIVEYVPGDLTMTARAGTPIAELASAARAQGQWLPLEPWGGDDGSLGATVSTATAGPFAHALGAPRDLVLGMEFVTGEGETVRSGGRVVKNVAGFDLTRLVVGAWGTLGIITEVSVRLRARPERLRTIAVQVPPTRTGLNDLAARLRSLPFAPLACEMLSDQLTTHLKLGPHAVLLTRIGGNDRAVAAQFDVIRELGDYADVRDDIWDALRTAERGAPAAWRWSQLPSQFGDTWTAADGASRVLEKFFVHGNPARGVVRVVCTAEAPQPAIVVRSATGFKGTVLVEQLPLEAWPLVSPSPADRLSHAVRDKFDPARILNPGIMGVDG